jgi:hypothetical protein
VFCSVHHGFDFSATFSIEGFCAKELIDWINPLV